MRAVALCLLGWSVAGLMSCSSDPNTNEARPPLEPGAGSGGTGAVGSNAGSGGSNDTGGAPSASGAGGASSEGNGGNVPLDPGNGGSAGNPGSAGSGTVADAGQTPLAERVCPDGPFADNPLPAGAQPAQVCGNMTFTEGAVWFAERNTLFFSDFQIGNAGANFDGQIWSHTPGGGCEPFIQNSGTNGLAIAPDGNLIGCRHSNRTLVIFDLETREPELFLGDNAGQPFNSPNDVTIRSDGNLYFTDPTYFAPAGSNEPGRVYRRDPSGALTVIDEGADPNGITLSPDETRLYVSHLGGGQNNVVVFDVDASGAVGEPQPFIDNFGSDGMAIDCAGNLYITQGGVRVYSPEGEPIGILNAQGAANVAFGGPDRRTLFITAGAQLLSVELAIPGLPY